MASALGSNPYSSIDSLEAAYQIGKFIHSHGPHEVKDAIDFGDFNLGPNPYYMQTKQGLVLEVCGNVPRKIHTPYGSWPILGFVSAAWIMAFEAMKESFGLVLLQEGKICAWESYGSFWAITKCGDKEVEMPEYKQAEEYISYENVKEVWARFAASHSELRARP